MRSLKNILRSACVTFAVITLCAQIAILLFLDPTKDALLPEIVFGIFGFSIALGVANHVYFKTEMNALLRYFIHLFLTVGTAIDVLMNTRGIRSVAILGDMFELGEGSKLQHELVGRYAAQKEVELLIAIGADSAEMARGAAEAGIKEVMHFETKDAFFEKMNSIIGTGDVILLKGSRGMEMDKIVKKIMEQ